MKKIYLRGVSESLSEREMKRVVGGNGCPPGCVNNGAGCVSVEDGNACGGSGGSVCCATSGNYNDPLNYCSNDPARAEAWAGNNGWWACNVPVCYDFCAGRLD